MASKRPTSGPGAASPKAARSRGKQSEEQRRSAILQHAVRHFARLGYAGADLDALASDVGCAKGTLYLYFDSKQDLFHAAVDFVMRGLLAETSRSESADDLVQLEDAVRAYLTYFDVHPEYVELLMLERAEFRDRKKPTYFEHRETNRKRWRKRFEDLMDAGRLRRLPPDLVLDAIGNLLYGTIFTNYFTGRRGSLERQVAGILDVIFHGVLGPSETPRRKPRP